MFKLGDIIVDRVLYGVAENFSGELQYVLTQLADATIEVTAESKDATDATGTLVKRFWQGKTGTFTANNAMLNMNILGAMSGSEPQIAGSGEDAIVMPKMITVKPGATADLKGFVDGTVVVYSQAGNGSIGNAYTKAAVASDTEFGLSSSGVFTAPTATTEGEGDNAQKIAQYFVKYDRKVEKGTAVKNRADKFPSTVTLTLKVLAVDPCEADTVRAAYVEMPSFQPSPETSVSLTTDAQLEFKGVTLNIVKLRIYSNVYVVAM